MGIDPSSNPDFSTGATLLPRIDGFRIDLSGTCETCFGLEGGRAGESIVPDVAVIPEPAPMALLGFGLAAMMVSRRRRQDTRTTLDPSRTPGGRMRRHAG